METPTITHAPHFWRREQSLNLLNKFNVHLTGKPVTDHAFTTDFQKADMKSFYMAMKSNSGAAAIKSVTRRKTLNKRQPSRNQVRKNRDWIIVDSCRGIIPENVTIRFAINSKKVTTSLILTRLCAAHTNPLLTIPRRFLREATLCTQLDTQHSYIMGILNATFY